MNKNLIVQINIPSKLYKDTRSLANQGPGTYGFKGKAYASLSPLANLSELAFRRYATQCGADYKSFTRPVYNWVSPSFERMRLIDEDVWADTYDNILYVDVDVIPHPQAPNVFDLFSSNTIRAVPKYTADAKKLTRPNIQELKRFEERGITPSLFKANYFNAGVILFNADGLRSLKKHHRFRDRVFEWQHGAQGEINFCVLKHKIPFSALDSKFNILLARRIPGSSYNAYKRYKKLPSFMWNEEGFFHFVGGNQLPPSSARKLLFNKLHAFYSS